MCANIARYNRKDADTWRDLFMTSRETASYLEFGRRNGHSVDYGHVDLILGRTAPEEVFPPIAAWLSTRAGAGRSAR
jgi:hypothetical protein